MKYTPSDWHEMFTYDNGRLVWNVRPLRFFHDRRAMGIANTSQGGRDAGSKHYRLNGMPMSIQLGLKNKKYGVHRIIWEMHNGPIPDGILIDHIDGDPFNNRIENLRLATNSQNSRNRSAIGRRCGMFKGVHWIAEKKKWAAFIRVDGKTHFICYAHDPEVAARRYDIAAILNHKEFARLNFP